jgi:hypothetical protein
MFRITANTCREFTFAEILIMAAINRETAISDNPVPPQAPGRQRCYFSVGQLSRT